MGDAGATRGFTVATRASIPSTIDDLALTPAIVIVAIVTVTASAATASLAPHLPCHFRLALLLGLRLTPTHLCSVLTREYT